MIGINYLGQLGRLANQMFQYASLKGIAKNRGFQYCIPPSQYRGVGNDQWQEHQLLNAFELKSLNPLQVQRMDEKRCMLVRPEKFSFDVNLFNGCPDNVSLFGYFQSEKYFTNVREELLEDFTFKDGLKEECEEFIKELAKKEMLRVVFRDSGFASDDVKDNVSQIFKQLNPQVEIKVI